MGGKDDDRRHDELSKWLDGLRADANKLQEQFEKDLRNWTDSAATSPSRGPFERFKNFVDENISTLSEGFRRFPSNIAELKAKMLQEREARQADEEDIWRRWTGSEDSPDHIQMQVQRASGEDRQEARDATLLLLSEAFRRNRDVDLKKIVELYKDNEWTFGGLDQFATPMLSFGGACYYKSETVDNMPSTARWGWPSLQPRWLSVDWFMRSPYSPVRLEHHPRDQSGARWRAAFEDLLSAKLDKPMMSCEKVGHRPPNGKPQSTYFGPGLDWMLSLQCRGILPPQLPNMYQKTDAEAEYRAFNRCCPGDEDVGIPGAYMAKQKSLQRDFECLRDAVSIKSDPDTEMQHMFLPVATTWKVPETEAELYEHLEMEPEDNMEDFTKAQHMLSEAMENGDAVAVRDCLEAFHETYGSIGDLVSHMFLIDNAIRREATRKWSKLLSEAVKMSQIPTDDIWRRIALLDEDGQERLTNELLAQSPRRGQAAMIEGNRLLGWLVGFTDDEEVDEVLSEIEQERDRCIAGSTASQTGHLDGQQAEDVNSTRPDILSQLTTTHTTKLPDGTVTTKVVLKQRFADGREEQHESVQTTREKAGHVDESLADQKQKASRSDKRKNGWFWT